MQAAGDRFEVPGGLESGRSRALAALVAEIAGAGLPAGTQPVLAPTLLFSDPALQAAMRLPEPGTGAMLIHEYQGLDATGPFPEDRGLAAEASGQRDAARAEYRFRLGLPGAAPAVELRIGLRVVPVAEVTGAKGMRTRPGNGGPDWRAEMTVSAGQIARYCALSGDANPIHRDLDYIARLGLPGPVVPGLLLLSLVQPGTSALWPGKRIASMKARFVAPIYQDAPVAVVLTGRGADPGRGTDRARAFLTGAEGAVAVVDLELAD